MLEKPGREGEDNTSKAESGFATPNGGVTCSAQIAAGQKGLEAF